MSPSFAPSSSTSELSYEYEVFVSFWGEDTHTTFACHLFAALDRKKICACSRGEFNRTELMKAIETSRMAVVVFSKSYATSDRCRDELAKIMECNRVLNQRVLPIFYDVSPSEVREQKGNFEEAANLAGFHLKPNRPESEFIEEIVENILKKLNEESSTAPSLRQNDAPIPHNDASSGQNTTINAIADWTPFFFFLNFFSWVRGCLLRVP
ncbi:disease resistance protein RPV1-like [Quercus robur]|uniref:disease resistance protein RPV1-like n=1 Tax=Quercus robur TaxID=38942 RepID=UPI0021613965|nr:disease resistance protein RPV1-like [Quercus robur]